MGQQYVVYTCNEILFGHTKAVSEGNWMSVDESCGHYAE